MKRVLACIGAVAVAWTAGPVAAETLSVQGARLQDVVTAPATANLTRTIDLAGDVPTETYVMAHMPDGRSLARTNLGYWQPWDGDVAKLIDNGFKPAGGSLTFKILKEDISGRFFPIAVTLAYRTGDKVKFGVFHVMPE